MIDVVRALPPDVLRARRSQKWSTYPADVLPAFIAEMDFAPPPGVTAALKHAIEASDFGYASARGLSDAFTGFAAHYFDWTADSERVFAAPDVMSTIEQVVRLTTGRGDGVVVNPPVYPPFFEVIAAAERIAVDVPLIRPADDWTIDFDRLERAFRSGARAYLLCSPHNPVGRVWTHEELRKIAALSEHYRVTVIADEIHSPLALEGNRHIPYLSVAGESDYAFAVYSASKAWNIPGLKCALGVAGSQKSAGMLGRHWNENPSETTWRIGNLGVLATIAAFRDRSGWLENLREHLAAGSDYLRRLFAAKLPMLRYNPPQASFLAWIDCSGLGFDGDPARHFLDRGRVALTSGRDFGAGAQQFVRLNMGTSFSTIEAIVERMRIASIGV